MHQRLYYRLIFSEIINEFGENQGYFNPG